MYYKIVNVECDINISALQMSLLKIELVKKTTDLVSCLKKTCVVSRETNTVNFSLSPFFINILLFLVFSVLILHRKITEVTSSLLMLLYPLCHRGEVKKHRDSEKYIFTMAELGG